MITTEGTILNSLMKVKVIEAEYVKIYCYIGQKHDIFNVLRESLEPQGNNEKCIKIMFLIINLYLD